MKAKQVVTAANHLSLLEKLLQRRQNAFGVMHRELLISDDDPRIFDDPQLMMFKESLAAAKFKLKNTPPDVLKAAEAWHAIRNDESRLATMRKEFDEVLAKAPTLWDAPDPEAAARAWATEAYYPALVARDIRSAIAANEARIAPDILHTLRHPSRAASRPLGRPKGGARTAADWRRKLEPYLPFLLYRPADGALLYGRTRRHIQNPNKERVTPAQVPFGYVVAIVQGHDALAVRTGPTWQWDTLRLTHRFDDNGHRLPDIHTDGTPVHPPALQAMIDADRDRKAKDAARKRAAVDGTTAAVGGTTAAVDTQTDLA